MSDQATLDKAFAHTDDQEYTPVALDGYTLNVSLLDQAEAGQPVQVSYSITRDSDNLGLGAYHSRKLVDEIIAADKATKVAEPTPVAEQPAVAAAATQTAPPAPSGTIIKTG